MQTIASVVTVSLVSMALLGYFLIRTDENAKQVQINQSIETMKRSVSIQLQYFDFSTLEYTLQEMNRAIGFTRIEAYDKYGTLRATIGSDVAATDQKKIVSLTEDEDVEIGTLLFWGQPTFGLSLRLNDPLIFGLFLPILLFVISGLWLHRNIRSKVIAPLQEMRESIRYSEKEGVGIAHKPFQFRELEEIFGAFEKAKNKQEQESQAKLNEISKRLSQTTVLRHALRNAGVAVCYLDITTKDKLQFLGTKLPAQIEKAFTQSDFSKSKVLQLLEAENCIVTEITLDDDNSKAAGTNPFTLQVRLGDRDCWRISLVTTANMGLALLAIDVSELYMAQNELFFQQRMDALGALTSGVAHDFNNILAIMLAGLENTNSIHGEQVQDSLKPVWSAAVRGRGLVRQLLTFARKTPRSQETIEPRMVVEHFAEIMPAVLGPHIRLKTKVLTDAVVNCDRNLLEVALTNFLVNARDAMPTGGVAMLGVKSVLQHDYKKYKLDKHQEYVDFFVTDEGKGISEEIREKIFDPFFTTKTPTHGTGLGLSLVYNFAIESGGKLTYEDLPNVGTCFHLILPKGAKAPDSLPYANSNNEALPLKESKLFIIDDEVSLVNIIKVYFERKGYQVIGFNQVATFLDQIEFVGSEDIVLTDIHLPDGSGLEIADALRNRNIKCRLILMSGNVDEGIFRSSEKFDAKVVEKPFQLSNLFEEVF